MMAVDLIAGPSHITSWLEADKIAATWKQAHSDSLLPIPRAAAG